LDTGSAALNTQITRFCGRILTIAQESPQSGVSR
jgi:hypothetical protein